LRAEGNEKKKTPEEGIWEQRELKKKGPLTRDFSKLQGVKEAQRTPVGAKKEKKKSVSGIRQRGEVKRSCKEGGQAELNWLQGIGLVTKEGAEKKKSRWKQREGGFLRVRKRKDRGNCIKKGF